MNNSNIWDEIEEEGGIFCPKCGDFIELDKEMICKGCGYKVPEIKR